MKLRLLNRIFFQIVIVVPILWEIIFDYRITALYAVTIIVAGVTIGIIIDKQLRRREFRKHSVR
jgi:hypothetical protein